MDISASEESPYINNNPLPKGQNKLRVLAIGNSYTVDATAYVQDILNACCLDTAAYSVYIASHNAATLRYWAEEAMSNTSHEIVRVAGGRMPVTEGPMSEILSQDWDVITLQQYSADAIKYSTFNPWLRYMIDFIYQHCPNQNVSLAWQMAWSYAEGFSDTYTSYYRWLLIAKTVKDMTKYDGVNIVIPVGTAIQNARCSELDTESELTRDGSHLDFGVGRYIAACTWIQTLFEPVFGISVSGNTSLPYMGNVADAKYNSRQLTIENRALCQRCAVAAVANPFALIFE